MTQSWGFLRRILSGLALIATLGVAVLPDGQLPRVAGPCGRALCNCPLEVLPTRESANCPACKVIKQAPRVVTLGPSVVSHSDDAGLAFQFAIDAGVPLARVTTPGSPVKTEITRALSRTFALTSTTFDIPTPPPRALPARTLI